MTADRNKGEVRCIGCGKLVEVGHAACQILTGKVQVDGFDADSIHGTLHRKCFDRTVESPDSVMDEIRRTAKAGRSLRA